MADAAEAVVGEWFAIQVRARHEFRVLARLHDAGIEAFLPSVARLRRWKDRKKLIEFPLFAGYIFVHIVPSHDNMLFVLKKQGVVRFLGVIPGSPEPIPDEQIASLQRLVALKQEIDPYPYLKEGERVKIRRGPLAGVEGILLKKAGDHLLVVSIDLLRQGVSVKIDASDIEAA